MNGKILGRERGRDTGKMGATTPFSLLESGAMSEIQTKVSEFISRRDDRRVAADEILDLDNLLAIGGEVLRISDRQIFRDLLRECDPGARIVFRSDQKRV